MTIRFATENDSGKILEFIHALADYEKLSHEVVTTEEMLRISLFGEKPEAEVLLIEDGSGVVGFALFFENYSTFLGRKGIYLEDLFVLSRARGKGFGMALLKRLAEIALERECGRLEWNVLDWNHTAIRFYESLGAKPMNGWTTFRLDGDALRTFSIT